MKTEIYVIQFKSVYDPEGPWQDSSWAQHQDKDDAIREAKSIAAVNPAVRLVKRTTTEEIINYETNC